MTTLTMDEPTPSERVVAKASATVQVQDARGRTITLKKPDVLAQFDLIEALGESAKNDVYVAMTLPLIYITKIDDHFVTTPTNKIQIRALIQQLGEDGVNCVMAGVQENFGGASVEGDKAAIKK
jgi:hypothetical protein